MLCTRMFVLLVYIQVEKVKEELAALHAARIEDQKKAEEDKTILQVEIFIILQLFTKTNHTVTLVYCCECLFLVYVVGASE